MAEQRPYRIPGILSGCEAGACETTRRALTRRSVHRDQLGDNAARRERASRCVVAGAPAVPPEGRSNLRAVVVDCLVDPMVLGAATGTALATVRSRGALPDVRRDGGLLRSYRDGAARLVRERLRPSRFRALGDDA